MGARLKWKSRRRNDYVIVYFPLPQIVHISFSQEIANVNRQLVIRNKKIGNIHILVNVLLESGNRLAFAQTIVVRSEGFASNILKGSKSLEVVGM